MTDSFDGQAAEPPVEVTRISSENPFEIVADYTYDWETWFLPDGRVKWINPAVERMTGYSVAECQAMADYPAALIHFEDRDQIVQLLKAARAGTSGNDVEFRFITKADEIGWAAVSWQQICDREGKSLGFRTSMREISERKKAEAVLRQAKAEAERANASKSRFLAAVSHDLRQPLQAISMFVATLQARQPRSEQVEILEDMQSCLESCNELLGDLLDISRLDAGAVSPSITTVCVGDVLENIEASMASSVAEKANVLRVVYSSCFVSADAVMVQRILQNLVSNANRYTSAGRILIGCRMRGPRAYIEVWDNGIGIAQEEREHIFEEFYQVGNPQRDRRKGVGLGLAIVRRLAQLMGADLQVNSWPGRGSVFALGLPIVRAQAEQVQVLPQPVARSLNGRRLVVVDDEPMQRKSLSQMLASLGACVVAAESASEAVEQISQAVGGLPDFAIVDYRLGDGLNGEDAIHTIRQTFDCDMPAIIITGDTAPERISKIEASGMIVMHKPVQVNELVNAISELL